MLGRIKWVLSFACTTVAVRYKNLIRYQRVVVSSQRVFDDISVVKRTMERSEPKYAIESPNELGLVHPPHERYLCLYRVSSCFFGA